MKIKIVGFKVGQSRPTANITVTISLKSNPLTWEGIDQESGIGITVLKVIDKSDFISIRKVRD